MVNTGRAPETSARLHTMGYCQVPQRLCYRQPPTCHSPLHHRWRQATHNTLGLGSCPTVSYLFRDRPIAWQVTGFPPPADVPGSHSNLRILVVTASWLSSVCGFCLCGVRSWKSRVWLFLWMKKLLNLLERCCVGRSGPIPLPWMSCDFTPLDNVLWDYVTEHIYIRPFGILLMERHEIEHVLRCALFWDCTQHRMVIPFGHFGITNWSPLQGSRYPRGTCLDSRQPAHNRCL